jgi:hypothetical protein
MRVFKIILATFIIATFSYALNPYIKGYKDYIRYIKYAGRKTILTTTFLKKLNVHTKEDLDKLFANNGELLLKKTILISPQAAKGLQKIIEKGDLPYLKVFFLKTLEGKLPAGCGSL